MFPNGSDQRKFPTIFAVSTLVIAVMVAQPPEAVGMMIEAEAAELVSVAANAIKAKWRRFLRIE